jgi:hypothetical protein
VIRIVPSVDDPPVWLDVVRRPRPTRACWTCGRGVAPMRFRADDLRRQDWAPPQTLQIPDWCGCSTEYLPVPAGDGWWQLVPIWEPAQTPNPLRRWAHPSAIRTWRHLPAGTTVSRLNSQSCPL